MQPADILRIFNDCTNKNYHLSKPIEDGYFSKHEIDVKGYGIYENEDYTKPFNCRYCLVIELAQNKSGKILTVLLMNPSKTFPAHNTENGKFDQTIRNLIILGNKLNYSHIIVLNAFAVIQGNSKTATEYYKSSYRNSPTDKLNRTFINKLLKNDNFKDLLLACGDKIDSELYSFYVDIIRENDVTPWGYSLTKKQRPRHLSLQSFQNRTAFYNFLKNPAKIYLPISK